MDAVEDRAIREGGACDESIWTRWLADTSLPPLDVDDLLPATRRLVIVSPHPDDEVIACGGLVARHAARGGRILVVAVTDGEASHAGDARWPATHLARARRQERLDGLARLGANTAALRCLDLGDGRVTEASAALRVALVDELQREDCVVTTWSHDGHPDHEATGLATAQACAVTGSRLLQAPVWMWHWSRPEDDRVPWSRLRGLRLTPAEQARKVDALQAHRTQLAPRQDEPPVLGDAIRARTARASEYYFT